MRPVSCSPSICEACGSEFACGAQSSTCWCIELKLSERLRAVLSERYKGCLCRPCLEGFMMADPTEREPQQEEKQIVRL